MVGDFKCKREGGGGGESAREKPYYGINMSVVERWRHVPKRQWIQQRFGIPHFLTNASFDTRSSSLSRWGLNEQIKQISKRFATEGFLVLAPDLYYGKIAVRILHPSPNITLVTPTYPLPFPSNPPMRPIIWWMASTGRMPRLWSQRVLRCSRAGAPTRLASLGSVW